MLLTKTLRAHERARVKQLLRVIKLITILMTAACMQVAARSAAQTVTLSVKDAPVKQVFRSIQQQTGLNIFIDATLVETAGKITLNVKDMPVIEVLKLCLPEQEFDYVFNESGILVKRKDVGVRTSPVFEAGVPPIKGVVRDAEGNPIQGVNVLLKGTKKGITTDAYGNFSIEAEANEVLVISSVGFSSKEIKVSNTNDALIVALDKMVSQLDEVVFNKGYYSEQQRFSVSNAATITSKDLEKQPVQNPLLALQGRVPGLFITQTTGVANGRVKLEIQGRNSLSSSKEPLVVVDGVPYPSSSINGLDGLKYASPLSGGDFTSGGSPLSFLNIADIESITVLKDADATAIYGSRAGNGAILIVTKKGKPGKTRVDLNFQQGWGKVTRKMEMLNTHQYLDMRYEALKNDGIDLAVTNPLSSRYWDLRLWDTTRYTDWQKELIGGTAQYTTANASVSGGSPFIRYRLGFSYNRTTDVFPGNMYNQTGATHLSIESRSQDQRFQAIVSASYSVNQNELPGRDLTELALKLEPIAPPIYNEDGSFNWAPASNGNSTFENPLVYTRYRKFEYNAKTLVTNIDLSYLVLDGLKVKTILGYSDFRSNDLNLVFIEEARPEARPFAAREANHFQGTGNTLIVEPQIQYQKIINSVKFDFLIGSTIQQNSNQAMTLHGTGYPTDQVIRSIGYAASVISGTSDIQYKYNAAYSRFNLQWNQKYLLNLTARRDGSSRFGDNSKFNNFYSVGAGWIFSEEKFVQRTVPILSFAKLRSSFGTTGHDQIGDYSYLSLYGNYPTSMTYQGALGLIVGNPANPYFEWEEIRKFQTGLDLGFLKDRVLISATYAINRSSNQLVGYRLPAFTGYESVTDNYPATIQNTSWELSMTSNNIKRQNFTWTTNLNFTVPRNKLVAFPGQEHTSYANNESVVVGQPLGIIKVFHYLGINPLTGQAQVENRKGEPTSTPRSTPFTGDRTVTISTLPRYYAGLQNSISYKNFQLDIFFQAVRQLAATGLSGSSSGSFFGFNPENQPASIFDRWQRIGDNALNPRFSNEIGVSTFSASSDRAYSYNASFVRLKNLSISWQFPQKIISQTRLQNCRVYFQGQNIATITRFDGLDPENTSSTSLPPLQMWTLGINAGF